MKNTKLIAVTLILVLASSYSNGQVKVETIAGCEVNEEFESDIIYYNKLYDWIYETAGLEINHNISQKKIVGFCVIKDSLTRNGQYFTIWSSNKGSSESPMSIVIKIFGDSSTLPTLVFAHPSKVEDSITAIESSDSFLDTLNLMPDTSVKSKDALLSHNGFKWKGKVGKKIGESLELKVDEMGLSYYVIEKKSLWTLLKEIAIAKKSIVHLDGKPYEMNDKAKEALGDMIFLWENYRSEFQH